MVYTVLKEPKIKMIITNKPKAKEIKTSDLQVNSSFRISIKDKMVATTKANKNGIVNNSRTAPNHTGSTHLPVCVTRKSKNDPANRLESRRILFFERFIRYGNLWYKYSLFSVGEGSRKLEVIFRLLKALLLNPGFKSMRLISITTPGGPEVLELAQRATPTPASHELLIRVAYAGVNRPDIAQRKGRYPAPPGAPADIPGLEVSGTVESIGSRTTRFKPGDQVCALLSGGGYAEYVTAPEGQCLPLPPGFSLKQAAALPETVFTVWHNVFQRGQLKSGEKLLVHGGTSGIGVMAIQMAKAAGAMVLTTAGTDEKCKACEQLGAALSINYNKQDFTTEVLNFTENKGVDVILDIVGGSYTQKNLDCLDTDGRLVLINFMAGDESSIRLSSILRKRLTVTGSTLRARDEAFKKDLANEVERKVWPWIEQGLIQAVIDSCYPLEEAAAAHQRLESGTHIGKILLEIK